MLQALGKTLAVCETDPDVACVVLTGAGGAFCAGGDVKGMAERNADGAASPDIDSRIHAQRLSQRATAARLYKMPKPTLAALPGAAAGAGLALALACDLRIASDNAVMTTAFARVGFSGDYGGTYFLTQLVGTAKARELYFLSDRVDMKEALRLGLVNWVVPADQLETKTMEIAHRLAAGPRVAYRYMKENLNRAAAGECGRVPRPRSDAPRPHGHDRRPQGGRARLRRKARARVQGAIEAFNPGAVRGCAAPFSLPGSSRIHRPDGAAAFTRSDLPRAFAGRETGSMCARSRAAAIAKPRRRLRPSQRDRPR